MHQSDSPFSEEVVAKIRSRVSDDDKPAKRTKSDKKYTLEGFVFGYNHGRPLPRKTAAKAMRYIRAIVAEYPLESRYGIAKPLWSRFCIEWCNTGDEGKSLRAI